MAILSVFVLVALFCSSSADEWDQVRRILRAYFPFLNVAFSAGNASGRQFEFEKGLVRMSSKLVMASASKFPAATAVAGAVADGHLSFDTYAHDVWPWWTSSPSDRKSRVTLRHLMSFTSGFYWHDAGGELPCLSSIKASSYTPEACAREIYDQAPFEFEPGSTWAYNSFHLQVAGAMAASAANLTVQQLLHKYLIGRLSMHGTRWLGGENPTLAGSMITTGDDYDKLLRAYVAYELLPKHVADEMEKDYLEQPVKIANTSSFLAGLLGHYSMCTYFECLPPKPSVFTPGCKKAGLHVDAGLFGYYPLIDRAHGTYMQVVAMKMVTSKLDFYLPTISSMVLRRIIKPLVDKALHPPSPCGVLAAIAAAATNFSDSAVGNDEAIRRNIWQGTWETIQEAGFAPGRFRNPTDFWERLEDLCPAPGLGLVLFLALGLPWCSVAVSP
mmetsp:Transcript_12352/g.30807  ORF Transcript_12352/g.30807 Transcript_12352/m.30807 type:complete len:443 (+) Transcript_12352:66-1394(+)